jgi:hypothetical protein
MLLKENSLSDLTSDMVLSRAEGTCSPPGYEGRVSMLVGTIAVVLAKGNCCC